MGKKERERDRLDRRADQNQGPTHIAHPDMHTGTRHLNAPHELVLDESYAGPNKSPMAQWQDIDAPFETFSRAWGKKKIGPLAREKRKIITHERMMEGGGGGMKRLVGGILQLSCMVAEEGRGSPAEPTKKKARRSNLRQTPLRGKRPPP